MQTIDMTDWLKKLKARRLRKLQLLETLQSGHFTMTERRATGPARDITEEVIASYFGDIRELEQDIAEIEAGLGMPRSV